MVAGLPLAPIVENRCYSNRYITFLSLKPGKFKVAYAKRYDVTVNKWNLQ